MGGRGTTRLCARARASQHADALQYSAGEVARNARILVGTPRRRHRGVGCAQQRVSNSGTEHSRGQNKLHSGSSSCSGRHLIKPSRVFVAMSGRSHSGVSLAAWVLVACCLLPIEALHTSMAHFLAEARGAAIPAVTMRRAAAAAALRGGARLCPARLLMGVDARVTCACVTHRWR